MLDDIFSMSLTSFRVRVMDRVRVRVRDPSLKSVYGFQVAKF